MKYKSVLSLPRVVIEGLLWLFILLVGAAFLLFGFDEQTVATELYQSGVATEGTVVNKRISKKTKSGGGPSGGSTTTTYYYVTYRFNANGQQVTEQVDSKAIYNSVREGETVNIRYLAEDPSVNEIEGSGKYQGRAESTKCIGGGIIIMAIIIGLIRRLAWLKWRRFESLPKETTQAKIVDRRVIESRAGKGGTSYTYYLTYQFEDIAERRTFTFEEKVSQEVYNWVSIGALLTVEYVIADPTLARRSSSK